MEGFESNNLILQEEPKLCSELFKDCFHSRLMELPRLQLGDAGLHELIKAGKFCPMNTKLRKQLHVSMIRERAEEVSRCQVSFVTSETRWIHFSVAYSQLMKFIKNVVSSF
jgi:hypothetical protein